MNKGNEKSDGYGWIVCRLHEDGDEVYWNDVTFSWGDMRDATRFGNKQHALDKMWQLRKGARGRKIKETNYYIASVGDWGDDDPPLTAA